MYKIDPKKVSVFSKLKRIDLINFRLGSDHLTRGNIDHFLQILAPLSPKETELRARLKSEITQEMRQVKQSWEIEKMKKQIVNEIDSKYSPKFDENELSCTSTSYNDEWHSSLEMLSIVNPLTHRYIIDHDRNVNTYAQWGNYCEQQLDSKRICTSLSNLKGLAIKMLQREEDFNIFTCIYQALLNSLTNQLRSLHIDNTVVA